MHRVVTVVREIPANFRKQGMSNSEMERPELERREIGTTNMMVLGIQGSTRQNAILPARKVVRATRARLRKKEMEQRKKEAHEIRVLVPHKGQPLKGPIKAGDLEDGASLKQGQ
jgi:hypothetical protein